MRSMQRFFEEGDKVKITLRFRGREMAHQELGYKLLQRVKDDTEKIVEGRVGTALRRPPDGHAAGAALTPQRIRCRVKTRRSQIAGGAFFLAAFGFPVASAAAARTNAVPRAGARMRRQLAGAIGSAVAKLDVDLHETARRHRAAEVD